MYLDDNELVSQLHLANERLKETLEVLTLAINALKAIDRTIYAGIKEDNLGLSFKVLEEVSILQFQQKVNSIKND